MSHKTFASVPHSALDPTASERIRRRRQEAELRLCREAIAGPLGHYEREAAVTRFRELSLELYGSSSATAAYEL